MKIYIRKKMLLKRKKIKETQHIQCATKATNFLVHSGLLKAQKNIAVYLPHNGELSTDKLIEYLWENNYKVFTPVIVDMKKKSMLFMPYLPDTKLKVYKLGILELDIDIDSSTSANKLDIVITPLVAFDSYGNRVGMGGGFYDRYFSFKRFLKNKKPKLIGWSYELQRLTKINPNIYDVPLDYVITEQQVYDCCKETIK